MTRYAQHLNIPVFRGDDIKAVQDENEIAVIKADVEGAELEVFKGLINTINRTAPFLILEILPVYDINDTNGIFRKNRQDEMLDLLRKADYNFYLIKEKEFRLMQIADVEVHGDMGSTNYLFVHSKHITLIRDLKHFTVDFL